MRSYSVVLAVVITLLCSTAPAQISSADRARVTSQSAANQAVSGRGNATDRTLSDPRSVADQAVADWGKHPALRGDALNKALAKGSTEVVEVYSSVEELDLDGRDFPGHKSGVLLKPALPVAAKLEILRDYNPQAKAPITLDKPDTQKLTHPCSSGQGAPAPAPASAAKLDPQSPLAQNINELGNRYWAGEVSAAMEAMRMLAGPLSPAEEKAFNESWAPMFDYPTDKAKAWLDRLTPLVTEFLAVQQQIESLLEAMENLHYEAEMAAAYEREDICADLLEQIGQTGGVLKKRKARLEELTAMLQAIGSPPNPLAEKCAAHKRAKKLIHLDPPKPGETKAPEPSGPLYPLPDSFFKRTPPSEHAYFKDKGMWFWLKLEQNGKGASRVDIMNELPYKARDDFSWHSHQMHGDNLQWNGQTFTSTRIEDGFNGYKCNEDTPRLHHKSRYDLQGTAAKDGGKLTQVTATQTMKSCNHIFVDAGADNVEHTADDRVRYELEVSKRTLVFKDLPLSKASPLLIGLDKGVELTYGVKGNAAAAQHLVSMNYDMPAAKPLDSNYISVTIHSMQGKPPKAVIAAAKPKQDNTARKIAFHENNIKWLKKDIAWINRQIGQAKDRAALKSLYFQLTCKQSDLQGEQDAITRIKTGQWVRTPTAWDGMVRAQMVANSRKMAAKIKKAETNRKGLDRMINALPPDQRSDMRKWVRRQLGDDPYDPANLKKVGQVVAKRLNAVSEGIKAQAASDEAVAQLGIDICNNYQEAATYAMYATPFVAGGGVLAITYGITQGGIVGYQTGGISGAAKGAATTALRYWSPKIDYAITFYEGYQQGGLSGAIKHTAITYIKRKAVQKVTQGVQGMVRYQQRRVASAKQARLNEWRDAQRRVRFKQEREYGESMVKRLSDYQRQYSAAKASGQGRKSLRLLEKRIMDQTAAIKNAPHAKGYLKFNASAQEKADYGVWDRRHTNKIVREMKQDLKRQGFQVDELRFKPIRNAGNTSPGMDLDLAMNSTTGNVVRWRNPKTGQVECLDLYTANAMVQDRFNVVYARNSGGRTAADAWQNVTTSKHLEAYPDTNWLHVKRMHEAGVDPRCRLDPNYAEDAGRVTLVKAHEMRRHGGAFTDNQNWEIYRGTSKDIKSKVLPLLERRAASARTPQQRAELQQKHEFYSKLSKAMDKANHDPVAADREVRKLTAMDTVDTVDMVSSAIEALGKWH